MGSIHKLVNVFWSNESCGLNTRFIMRVIWRHSVFSTAFYSTELDSKQLCQQGAFAQRKAIHVYLNLLPTHCCWNTRIQRRKGASAMLVLKYWLTWQMLSHYFLTCRLQQRWVTSETLVTLPRKIISPQWYKPCL